MPKSKILRGQICWVNLDPTIGTEIQKTRPAVIISNNTQNNISRRVVIIPITSKTNTIYPFEAEVIIDNKSAKILTDQIRTVDKAKLGSLISELNSSDIKEIEKALKLTLSLE